MVIISINFLAGRYHATPWDRHVNEGSVAWPPEPWRILRALIATWHHKIKPIKQNTERVFSSLVESLASEPPLYTLPAASHSHTRHYMPQWKMGETSLVFDAFFAVRRDQALYMTWDHVELSNDQSELLDDLLVVMGYLGRAESWVEAKQVLEKPVPNCVPGTDVINAETGEAVGESINLLTPIHASEYGNLRKRFLADKRALKKLGGTLPENLIDALSLETSDLRKQGWSHPPASRKVTYVRPNGALRVIPKAKRKEGPNVTMVRFLLVGKPLPQVEDSLRIGELFRMAVMSQFKDSIPPKFSGHGLPEGNRHEHAFYLPWDENEDGRIERLILYVPAGIDAEELRILKKTPGIWSRDGSEWRLVFENAGESDVGGRILAAEKETTWTSETPYMHPWHLKKKFPTEEQIRRECRERGFPDVLSIDRLDLITVGKKKRSRSLRPIHFRRFRSKREIIQPDRKGCFLRLTFAEAVSGPISLGFGCHFGLGLFAPMRSS